ncbi:cytochrome c oxidase assembly protein [Ureibacillus acetophenoni]
MSRLHNNEYTIWNLEDFLILIFFIVIITVYVSAVKQANRKYRNKWPIHRICLFISGVICIMFAVFGPIAEYAHHHFVFHMYSHLMLGMLGPLLMALSAPMTLLLRSLSVRHARKISKLLKSKYVQFVSHPIIASILNLGGLWILYTTSLFETMHYSTILYVLVHTHIFLAGFLFTIAIIYIDPTPYRRSFLLRSVVLVLYMAGHSILSKWIFANPPVGVKQHEAEIGGMTMYYGGDLIDVMIAIILCYQIYKSESLKNIRKAIQLKLN